MVQCSPVQPWWQSHLPSLHTPWSMQRGWQSLCRHSGPAQPSSQWHEPLRHTPWAPQSTTHSSEGHMTRVLRSRNTTVKQP